METPRGKSKIQGSGILVRTVDGEWIVIYSAAYLQQEANVWIQEQATTRFGLREIARRPYSIVYDERSGNVIVAMGLQGVVVGTPNGQWSRLAVGDYSPTDFSSTAKTVVLLSNLSVWVTTLALFCVDDCNLPCLGAVSEGECRIGIAVTLGILVPLFGLPSLLVVLGLESAVPTMFSYFLLASPLLILTAIGLAIRLAFVSRDTRVAKGFALAMGIISVTTAAAVLLPFGVGGDGFLIFYYLIFTTLTALFRLSRYDGIFGDDWGIGRP